MSCLSLITGICSIVFFFYRNLIQIPQNSYYILECDFLDPSWSVYYYNNSLATVIIVINLHFTFNHNVADRNGISMFSIPGFGSPGFPANLTMDSAFPANLTMDLAFPANLTMDLAFPGMLHFFVE